MNGMQKIYSTQYTTLLFLLYRANIPHSERWDQTTTAANALSMNTVVVESPDEVVYNYAWYIYLN